MASNADAFKSSIATQTANALSVDASQVKVEIMAGAAASLDSGRRLAEVSVVFAVTVEGASQGQMTQDVCLSGQHVRNYGR